MGLRWRWALLGIVLMGAVVRCGDDEPEEAPSPYRSFDGTGNNLANPQWGAINQRLERLVPARYADGVSSLVSGPGARAISNAVFDQAASMENARDLSDWIWAWGQFIDHDLGLTPPAINPEGIHIPVPTGDPDFDPTSSGIQTLPLIRTSFVPGTGTSASNPRQQINTLNAFLDGSVVYGHTDSRARALRTQGGTGAKLLTSHDTNGDGQRLLPRNKQLVQNDTGGHPDGKLFFLAGDVRTNENAVLIAVHTLWMREHNRIVDELAARHPDWSQEQLYQHARKHVGALIAIITFNEFLPALMGSQAPPLASTYDAGLNPGLLNEFSTAGFRVGHTMLPNTIARVQNDGSAAPAGPFALADSFFNPVFVSSDTDVEYLLKGLATQKAQEIDSKVNDSVRNMLFGAPAARKLDLVAINIQRGRDHGLGSYNDVRQALGLSRAVAFSDISSSGAVQAALASVYGTPNDVDLWVGALAEDHVAGTSLGPLLVALFREQFRRTRDGDRFWYRRDPALSSAEIATLEATRLSDVIERNTGLTSLQGNVFFAP